jgi:trigger factor
MTSEIMVKELREIESSLPLIWDNWLFCRSKNSVLSNSLEISAALLPKTQAPTLKDLSIVVPSPNPLEQDAMISRLKGLCLQHGYRQVKFPGELIGEGDLIEMNVIGYMQDQIIPFSTMEKIKLILSPDVVLPGFCDAMVGLVVGQSASIKLTFPSQYQWPELRGVQGRLEIDLLGAEHITPLDPESEDGRTRLNLGNNYEQIAESLLKQMEDEMAEDLLRQGTRMLLEELVKRATFDIPDHLLELELKEHWLKREGHFLHKKKIPSVIISKSWNTWLNCKTLTDEIYRRLSISTIIHAACEQLAPAIQPPEIEAFLKGLAETLGLDEDEAQEELAQNPKLHQKLVEKFSHLRTVDFLLSKTHIDFALDQQP